MIFDSLAPVDHEARANEAEARVEKLEAALVECLEALRQAVDVITAVVVAKLET